VTGGIFCAALLSGSLTFQGFDLMYSGLLIILLPLILGYLIPVKNRALLHVVNQMLS